MFFVTAYPNNNEEDLNMRRLCPLLFLLLITFSAQGQYLGVGRRAKAGEEPPKAVLVELLTRQNQRDYLVKNRPQLLREFDHDVAEVTRRTLLNWSHYFHYCPLYFFADTMADRIMHGQFAGVLLDSALKPVANPVIKEGERRIYIAYFGMPIPQPDVVKTVPGPLGQYAEHDGDDPTSLIRERLLVVDADFVLLSETKPRSNFVRATRPSWMSGDEYRKYRRSITYNADRWYIDYQPVAYSYDATLRRYFRSTKKETDAP